MFQHLNTENGIGTRLEPLYSVGEGMMEVLMRGIDSNVVATNIVGDTVVGVEEDGSRIFPSKPLFDPYILI